MGGGDGGGGQEGGGVKVEKKMWGQESRIRKRDLWMQAEGEGWRPGW